ncbi:17581_t:CDS:2 [Entrophospora sp. SA101]|nr:17581_t:CDS:2 [Entrophospora sp. SA101]
MDSVVESLVQEWLRLDKNPSTRAEIEKLYGERNIEELGKRLLNRISFGTAGLRSKMEAGFSLILELELCQKNKLYNTANMKWQFKSQEILLLE